MNSNESKRDGVIQFDVFLAHNSRDKPEIHQLANALEAKGITTWIDIEQIAPGQSFQDSIQNAIRDVRSIAICVGTDGLGKWQEWELKAAISKCVNAGIPVIPVLLPEVERLPDALLFLSELNWVKFKTSTEEETQILRLIWGISGTRPAELGEAEPTGADVSVSTANRSQQGQPGRSSGVIFGLHGILTDAAWHRTLYEVLGNHAWQVRTERWTFGKFSLLKFLSPWARSAKVKWFREVYVDETKDRRVQLSERDRPSIVAHSFGTYILGNALLKYDWLHFDKIVLCGSILPVDFPWDELIERGQVQSVRNEYGVNDIWVRLVGWFIPNTGPSGYSSFTRKHECLKQERFDFDHSEYFDYGHMEAKWLPFLQEDVSRVEGTNAVVNRPAGTHPWGLYFLYLLAVAATVYLCLLAASYMSGGVTDSDGRGTATPSLQNTVFDTPVAEIVPPIPLERIEFGREASDIDLTGFEIIEDHRILDLRRVNDVPASLMTTRHSPACWYRRVKLMKTRPVSSYIARFGTSGSGVDAKCTSHSYKVIFSGLRSNSKEESLMKNFDLEIDVSSEPLGKPFEILVEATMWNGFTQSEEWTGFDAYEDHPIKLKSLKVLFPQNKPFTNLWYRVTEEETDDVRTKPSNFREHRDKANRGVAWQIEESNPVEWIETRWTW